MGSEVPTFSKPSVKTSRLSSSLIQKTVTFQLDDTVVEDQDCYKSESHWLPQFKKEQIVIQFETQPVWLLALNKSFARQIIFPGFNSLFGLKRFISQHCSQADLYLTTLASLGEFSSFWFGRSDHSPVLHLISGSTTFESHVIPCIETVNRAIGIFEGFCKARTSIKSFPSVRIIKHTWVGGASTFQTIYATTSSLKLNLTTLRRSVGAFLNYKHKVTQTQLPKGTVMDDTELVRLNKLPATLRLPLTFYPNKLGYRMLELDEISHLVGLQSSQSLAQDKPISDFVPVQILDALLGSILVSQLPESKSSREKSKFIPEPHFDHPKGVFISSLKLFLPATWCHQDNVTMSAAKNDNALVPSAFWNQRIVPLFPSLSMLCDGCQKYILDQMRVFVSQLAKRRFTRELFVAWSPKIRGGGLKNGSNIVGSKNLGAKDLDFPRSSIVTMAYQYADAQFLSWSRGSSIYFWRWSPRWQKMAAEGIPPKLKGPFPCHLRPARRPKADIFQLTLEKFKSFIHKGYFSFHHPEFTKSYVDYFCVPKGTDDVRVVFNGASSKINETVWAPNFWLPTSESLLRVSHFGSKYVDLDLGEMFLNSNLHASLQPFSGVDLTPFAKELRKEFTHLPRGRRLIGTWNRTWMGFTPSPETSIRMYYLAEEFIRGDRKASNNPLRWDEVVLNCFGTMSYDPSLPTVYKWDGVTKQIAGDVKAFVDDLRAIGHNMEHAWSIARLIATRLQYLGIQDAPRKRRIDHGP